MAIRALVLVLVALAAGAFVASGDLYHQRLAVAVQRAEAYWGAVPCNGRFTVEYARLPDGVAGSALLPQCDVQIAEFVWAFPALCEDVTHEIGHLILGPEYFAAVNPGDPSHSPDPQSVMYYRMDGINTPAVCYLPWPRARRRAR